MTLGMQITRWMKGGLDGSSPFNFPHGMPKITFGVNRALFWSNERISENSTSTACQKRAQSLVAREHGRDEWPVGQ
jgi:hypothetical protein